MEHQNYPERAAQFPGNNTHSCSMPEGWDGEQPRISTAKTHLASYIKQNIFIYMEYGTRGQV